MQSSNAVRSRVGPCTLYLSLLNMLLTYGLLLARLHFCAFRHLGVFYSLLLNREIKRWENSFQEHSQLHPCSSTTTSETCPSSMMTLSLGVLSFVFKTWLKETCPLVLCLLPIFLPLTNTWMLVLYGLFLILLFCWILFNRLGRIDKEFWGTHINLETHYILMEETFEFLKFNRVGFNVDISDTRYQNFLEGIGMF